VANRSLAGSIEMGDGGSPFSAPRRRASASQNQLTGFRLQSYNPAFAFIKFPEQCE
jgi:hypothetical protein